MLYQGYNAHVYCCQCKAFNKEHTVNGQSYHWTKLFNSFQALRNAGVLGTLILPAATEQETGLDSTAGDLTQQELLEGNNPPNISKDTTISEANNETQVDTPLAEGLEIQNIQPPICEHSIEEEVVTSKDSFRFILLKRFLYFVFLLCLLLIGIFCRCFFLHDGSFVFQGNDTYIYENYDTGTARYGIDN